MPEAEVKEIVEDYVLIVYDLPAKEKKLRASFLSEAKSIGAIGHTQSCYLIPYSEKSFELANELAMTGSVFVWKSQQKDKEKALQITTTYEKHLKARCDYIEQRITICQEHITAGRLGVAQRMGVKTGKLLVELNQIAESFSPDWLRPKIEELLAKLKEIYQ